MLKSKIYQKNNKMQKKLYDLVHLLLPNMPWGEVLYSITTCHEGKILPLENQHSLTLCYSILFVKCPKRFSILRQFSLDILLCHEVNNQLQLNLVKSEETTYDWDDDELNVEWRTSTRTGWWCIGRCQRNFISMV